MFALKGFAFPILTAFAASCLACGSAAAQDTAAPKTSQDAPKTSQQAASGMAIGKRRTWDPLVITKEVGKQAKPHTMADMDTDKDGRLSRSEFAAAHGGKTDEFAAYDSNGDGFITQAEMDARHAAMEASHEAAHVVHQADGKPQH